MRLADQIAQCRTPFIVEHTISKRQMRLMGAADFSSAVVACPTRYSLSDDLVRLCTALAYSKGARTLACADLLRVPGERVWIEWCEAPWITELNRYGFRSGAPHAQPAGRRGAFIQSSPQGRRGLIKSFWTHGDTELDVFASSMEAYFDFDTEVGEDPAAPDGRSGLTISVFDRAAGNADILRRCFRFPLRALLAELLRTGAAFYLPGRVDRTTRTRHHCDRHPGDLGVPLASGDSPRPAAPGSHAGKTEPGAHKIGKDAAPGSHRSLFSTVA